MKVQQTDLSLQRFLTECLFLDWFIGSANMGTSRRLADRNLSSDIAIYVLGCVSGCQGPDVKKQKRKAKV